jgi:7-carboxy-7-deazaguanine synthase
MLGDSLQVQEIFPTIQGEGPLSGIPAVFVRLAGCNLKCWWCDTEFESNIDNWLDVDEIVSEVRRCQKQTQSPLVVLTGGEPMRQNLRQLVAKLCEEQKMHVQIETAGTIAQMSLSYAVRGPGGAISLSAGISIVVSPKTAKIAPWVENSACAWKYIIRDGELEGSDGLPNKSTQQKGHRAIIRRPPSYVLPSQIFVQPCDEGEFEQNLRNRNAAVESAKRFGYRLSLQQHKLLNLP